MAQPLGQFNAVRTNLMFEVIFYKAVDLLDWLNLADLPIWMYTFYMFESKYVLINLK
jgi:hypothetical protein